MPLPSALNPPIANTARLRDAILSLQPTAYWPLDDGSGPLRDVARGWSAAVTGSPLYGVAAPIGRGITWSGSGQYATTSTSIPNPSDRFGVLLFFRSTSAFGAAQSLAGRMTGAGGYSWTLTGGTPGGFVRLTAWNTVGGVYGTAYDSVTTNNNGAWHMAYASVLSGGSVDVWATPLSSWRARGGVNTSSAFTGTWLTASTAPIEIAATPGSYAAYEGTLAHVAYWSDRLMTEATLRWLHSIAGS